MKLLGPCQKGSILCSLKLFLTCEQVELFTTYAHKKRKKENIIQEYFLVGRTNLKLRNIRFYVIL